MHSVSHDYNSSSGFSSFSSSSNSSSPSAPSKEEVCAVGQHKNICSCSAKHVKGSSIRFFPHPILVRKRVGNAAAWRSETKCITS